MKKIIICLILTVLLITGCSKKEYKLAILSDYPPYIFNYEDNYIGMYVDVLNLIAEKSNFKYTIEKVDRLQLKEGLAKKKYAAVFSNNIKDESLQPLQHISSTVIQVGSFENKNEIDDIEYSRIGILKDSYIKKFAYKIRDKFGFALTEYENDEELIKGLKTKEIDKVIEDERVMKYLNYKHGLICGETMQNTDVITMLVSSHYEDFKKDYSNGLLDIINNGMYEKIKKVYDQKK